MNDLRTKATRANPLLLLVNCETLKVQGFDGRIPTAKAEIDIDEDTTSEGLRRVLEDFRQTCSVANMEYELCVKTLNESFAYAEQEVASWSQ